MTTALAKVNPSEIMEQVIIKGDLSKLTPEERVKYYSSVCESLGLNPLVKPFDYINLSGKLTLYATRTATDQLRTNKGISITIVNRERIDDIYIVTARGVDRDGRTDESTGAVCIAGLKGDALANAYMKAETKAKRRATLSLAGLGWMDETETETVKDARPVSVNTDTGEIIDIHAAPQPTPPAAKPRNKNSNPLITVMTKYDIPVDLAKDVTTYYTGKQSSKELTVDELHLVAGYLEAIATKEMTWPPDPDGLDINEEIDWTEADR